MMTLLFLQRITTPTPFELVAKTIKACPEVQKHSSSSDSDSSRKVDDVSRNDEPEMLESPNKKSLEHTSVSPKPCGEKKSNNAKIEKNQ